MSRRIKDNHGAKPSHSKGLSTFTHFRRLLSYVWPHKRYLFPALGCILLMAVTYSISIWSILPVLTVMVEPEGLHGRFDRYIAEELLDCEFTIYNSAQDRQVEGIGERTAQIRDLKPDSALAKAGLKRGDFITVINGKRGQAVDIFGIMVANEDSWELSVYSTNGKPMPPVLMEAPPAGPKIRAYKTLRRAVALIPRGQTDADKMRTLVVILLLLLVVVITGNVARLFAEYLAVLVNTRAVIDIRRQMYAHVLKLPMSRFSENTSDTMSRFMQDMNDIFRGLNNFFQKLVTEPFKALGVIILALALNWKLAVVLMLGAPVVAVMIRKLGKKIRRANKKLLVGYGRMLGQLESTLTGMRVVKGYMRENYERRQLFKVDRTVLRQQIRMGFIEALISPLVETLGFIAGAVAIFYFAHHIIVDKDMSTPEFFTVLVCLGAIFDPVRKLSTVYPKLQRANAAAERVFNLIDSPSEYDQDAGKPNIAPIKDSIKFDNVTFTYPGSDRPAIRNVSLTVKKGEVVALVGPNGSGKTTLLSLLPRFFSITSGRILIDDQDIEQITIRSLRRQFSLITQESVIFPDTVRANIAYGKPDASRAEIEATARKAFADEFIQQMPAKYDAMVGEHGATLSGGQRQRIAIARAILRNAPILIFDEATSQVDPESELKIHQALEAFLQDRTAFIIAHRYSTISDADRIVVMDEGEVIAVGTHDHLLESCPLYRRLYETQFRNTG